MRSKIVIQTYNAPCGELRIGSLGDRLCICDWATSLHPGVTGARLRRLLQADFEEGTSGILQEAAKQLDEYFARQRHRFDIPLLFAGSEFQKRVWCKLLEIPYGTTVSYGELAAQIGMPKAVRAVANANGANAISIFAPCHRVIGSHHALTGYGGGLPAKRFLLELESRSNVSPMNLG